MSSTNANRKTSRSAPSPAARTQRSSRAGAKPPAGKAATRSAASKPAVTRSAASGTPRTEASQTQAAGQMTGARWGLALPGSRSGTRRLTSLAWLRRRWWMLAVGLILGLAAGIAVASMPHTPSYSASATIVVQSGASSKGPGSGNDAIAVAVTYAALLPSDQALDNDVAQALGTTAQEASENITATAASGTALINVSYKAASPQEAIRGANVITSSLTSDKRTQTAVAKGSVALVSNATTATAGKSYSKYAGILGAIFGLLVGAGVVLIAERSDRRIDDIEALSDAAGTNVAEWPGGISALELVRGLGNGETVDAVTVMPVKGAQGNVAEELAALINRSGEGVRATVASAAELSGWQQDIRPEPLVLVVAPGEPVRSVRELVARLRLLRATPAWSVLASGERA